MSRAAAALFAALLASMAASAAPAPPPRLPLRDVDVTYKVPVPVTGGTAILQRFRWSAALRTQRVDLPTSGQWMVLDYGRRVLSIVREQTREVVTGPAPPEDDAPLSVRGTDVVAGLPCTILSGAGVAETCVTADGVLLRVRRGERTILEADSVRYAAQDASVFVLPAGYAVAATR